MISVHEASKEFGLPMRAFSEGILKGQIKAIARYVEDRNRTLYFLTYQEARRFAEAFENKEVYTGPACMAPREEPPPHRRKAPFSEEELRMAAARRKIDQRREAREFELAAREVWDA